MGQYRKTYPVRFGSNGNDDDFDDEEDDFRPRKRKQTWIRWFSDTDADLFVRIMAMAMAGFITFFIFKLNERMGSLEMKFAVWEVRHEIKSAQVPSVMEEHPGIWAEPELTIVPNFVRDYFGVRPTPPMNRKRKK